MTKIKNKSNDNVIDKTIKKLEKMIRKEEKGKANYDEAEFNELYRLLLDKEDDPLCKSLLNLMIAIYMIIRIENKVNKMEKDEKNGKRNYTYEEYDEVYDRMPVFIEYDDKDGDGYWDLNL